MKSSFSDVWDEVERSARIVEQERGRLEDAGLNLDVLKEFKRYDANAYDYCKEHGNEMLAKFAADYRKAAGEFNRLLDERIISARRFVVEQKREEKQMLEQKIREAQRHAVDEARKAVRIEQQLTAEKTAVESQLNNAEHRVKNLETHLGSHEDLKKTYNRLADQVDYLGTALDSLRNAQTESDRRLQSELKKKEELIAKYKSDMSKKEEQGILEALKRKKIDLPTDHRYELPARDSITDALLAKHIPLPEPRQQVKRTRITYEQEFEPAQNNMSSGYFDFGEFVEMIHPDEPGYMTIGLMLAGKFGSTNQMDGVTRAKDLLEERMRANQYAQTQTDVQYMQHLSIGVQYSLKNGDLRFAVSGNHKNRKEVDGLLALMGKFVEKSKEYIARMCA